MITNTGEPINLGEHAVDVNGMYTDWEYVNSMPSVTDHELFEEMYVNSEGIALESDHLRSFPLGKNETFTYGTNFHYQQGSDIIFTAKYTPVDDQEEPLSEDAVQAKSKTQIK